MLTEEERARKLRACNLLVDALVAAGEGEIPDAIDRDAVVLAFSGVVKDGIIRVKRENDDVHIDVTPLVLGSLDLLLWLARVLADHAGADPIDVFAELRQQVDGWAEVPS